MSRKTIDYLWEMKDQLLPCPWCGDSEDGLRNPPFLGFYRQKNFDDHYSVSCQCCGAESNMFLKTKEEAILHWNNRKTLSSTNEFKHGVNSSRNEMIEILNKMIKESV